MPNLPKFKRIKYSKNYELKIKVKNMDDLVLVPGDNNIFEAIRNTFSE